MTNKYSRYPLGQRIAYRIQDALHIQTYAYLADGTVRPSLYYRGWKLQVTEFFMALRYGKRYHWMRAAGFSHAKSVRK